jgi:Uma2 family endonuclease
MSLFAAHVAYRIALLLGQHCEPRKLGWLFTSDASYQCFPQHPNRVRKPDVSFIAAGRMNELPEGHCPIPPDLAVEVTSPNDVFAEVTAKIEEYLTAGVRLVWVFDTASRRVLVYRSTGPGAILGMTDDLSGEDVLPEFRCRIGDVFHQPATQP